MRLFKLALLGAALVGSAFTVVAAPVQVPFFKDAHGNNTGATGVICLRVDGTSCTFSGAEYAPSGVAPVFNNAITTQTDVGPFTPVLGRPIIFTATGTGTMQILRSVDGGTTKLAVSLLDTVLGPYTVTDTLNGPMWSETEAVATIYLRIIPSAGTMTGRISQ